jgi:hypothetical protein
MAGTARTTRWRTPAILAGSVALHAVVLGVLGLRSVGLTDWRPPEPVVLIDITPRPLLPDEMPREPRYAAPREEAIPERQASSAVADRRMGEEEEDALSPPQPRTSASGAPGPSAADQGIDDAWRVPTSPTRRQVGRVLRGSMIGCDVMNGRLSPGEQAQCDEAFNRAAGEAPPLTGSGDAARDARFAAQGARELAAYEGRRAPLAGGTGIVEHGDCPGSNFGTGCPGAHLDRGWRRDNNDEMSGAQGRYAR